MPNFNQADGPLATRSASGKVLNSLAESIDNLFGGSADLEPSNNSYQKNKKVFNKQNFDGNNIHYGVREHAMASIANGMAVHGGVVPYVATFLIFSDFIAVYRFRKDYYLETLKFRSRLDGNTIFAPRRGSSWAA